MENDIRELIRETVEEFAKRQEAKSAPAHQAELMEERKRREQLERRVNELVEENKRSRKAAEEAERGSAIRAELQRLGVKKVDLAFKAVHDGVYRTEDGRFMARGEGGETGMKEYLARFVSENPEFLPARIAGGAGVPAIESGAREGVVVDLDSIRPGMEEKELERIRGEVARVAQQALRGMQ